MENVELSIKFDSENDTASLIIKGDPVSIAAAIAMCIAADSRLSTLLKMGLEAAEEIGESLLDDMVITKSES
jgi:hypothetical protein